MELNDKVEKINNLLGNFKKLKLIKRGYACGVVNGLRIAKSIMEGKERELILERNGSLKNSREDIEIVVDNKDKFYAHIFKNGKFIKLKKL